MNDLKILEKKEKEIEEEKPKEKKKWEKIVIGKISEQKDPKFIYFIDKDGSITKIKKSGKKRGPRGKGKKVPLRDVYQEIDLSIPKFIFSSWAPDGYKKVGKFSEYSGYLFVHKKLIGQEFKVILIPKEEWEKNYAKKN